MLDLALDHKTHDLQLNNFDLSLCTEKPSIKQNLKIRLWFFAGEWFLDTAKGVKYYEDILLKNPNVPNIDSIIKATILETEHVHKILAYSSDFDSRKRKLTINFSVDTAFGIINMEEALF